MSDAGSLGKIFQEKREKLDLEKEHVSAKTYINVKVINDIESGIFDKISSVYMRSFVKKYANFLELDQDHILKKYDDIMKGSPVKTFLVEKKQPKKRNNEFFLGEFLIKKKLQIISALFLFVVFIVLLLLFINVTRKALKSPPRQVSVVARSGSGVAGQIKMPVVPVETKKKIVPEKRTAEKPSGTSVVSLTLKARDRVWIQVSDPSGEKVFDGFLKSGDSREWRSEGELTIWTGKANMLDFTVNGRDLGVVASGVVKNIRVSEEGVLVGDDWVVRF